MSTTTQLSDGRYEIIYDDGSIYRGEMINGNITGKGYLYYKTEDKKYTGSFLNGQWNGYGKAQFGNTEVYEGYWKNNVREGKGETTFTSEDGIFESVWEGTYHNDILDGEATGRWADGTVLKGRFREYELMGSGIIIYGEDHFETEVRGCTYEGDLPLGDNFYRREGNGKLTDTSKVTYEGKWAGGKLSGPVKVIYPDGREESAVYLDGKRMDASMPDMETVIHEEESHSKAAEFRKDPERFMTAHAYDEGNYSPEISRYFRNVIGMDGVKEQLDKMYKRFRIDQMRQSALGLSQAKQGYYFILTGNPGTGKTTVARIIGRMLHDLGILTEEVFVEVDRSKLVGEYIGQTAVRTAEVIGSARGGTLFIDEAYTLYRKDNEKDFGTEAIDTLLKDMEDHRGEYCVILAGYADQMNDMIRNANPGLASRFDHKINIDDYSSGELVDILVTMADSRHLMIEKDAEKVILQRIGKEKIDDTFDNARFARRLLDEAVERQAVRLSENIDELKPEDLQILKAGDFGKIKEDISDLGECLEKLDSLVGLGSVKREVNSFVRAVRIQNESRKRGLNISRDQRSLNMVFTGNPGTGKTTVARLLGQIYYRLGLLQRPDVFVECVRADLVGRYQGDTALKVKDVIRRALGGVLFIDEAYSLVMDENDSFGIEAVNTLVSEIENNRDKLAVIMAGYTDEMNRFLDSNPGLRSRLPRIIEFQDYSLEELCRIFRLDMENRGYSLTITDEKLENLVASGMTDRDFGNARGVRNLCEHVIAKQNERINELDFSSLSNEAIVTITDEDLVI